MGRSGRYSRPVRDSSTPSTTRQNTISTITPTKEYTRKNHRITYSEDPSTVIEKKSASPAVMVADPLSRIELEPR
jgi:hypothetical protein